MWTKIIEKNHTLIVLKKNIRKIIQYSDNEKISAMKIIGLLFGLYLGSIMSVQAQDLSKDATSIITDSRTEVLCKSMTQSIEKESRTILILNRKGLNAAYFVCECDMFRSLQKFSGEILNASGQSVRKIKKIGTAKERI